MAAPLSSYRHYRS